MILWLQSWDGCQILKLVRHRNFPTKQYKCKSFIGGATTFFNGVDLVKFWPTKGAAAFWFGIFDDGFTVRMTI